MKSDFHFLCSICGEQYPAQPIIYDCPSDGGNLDLILDYQAIARAHSADRYRDLQPSSLWDYQALLPVDPPALGLGTPLMQAGGTPLYHAKRLASDLGLSALWIKDESPNPTGSFKDRASAVIAARAQEIQAEVIVTASSGNAGAALAGMAAAIGQRTVIFVPAAAPQAKIAQLRVFGSQVLLVDGNYDAAFDLSREASDRFGWYCRNTGYNPFTTEGKKTASFEIWSQLWGNQQSGFDANRPLNVFVSVGDGNIVTGIHKGFQDLVALGWLNQMPRIFGVQAEGSAAVLTAFEQSKSGRAGETGAVEIKPVQADTLADSISVDLPRDGYRALRAALDTDGAYVGVSDAAILEGIAALGKTGIFAEPAAAASYAGVVAARERGWIGADDQVVAVVTGSGLKDVAAAIRAAGEAPVIQPTMQALEAHLNAAR
jgi:threonine synthase